MEHLTPTQLEDYRDLVKHVLRDPDLLVRAAAQRNMTLFDAFVGLTEELERTEARLSLVTKQEGVK